jgi:hypothetical protein
MPRLFYRDEAPLSRSSDIIKDLSEQQLNSDYGLNTFLLSIFFYFFLNFLGQTFLFLFTFIVIVVVFFLNKRLHGAFSYSNNPIKQ